MDVPNPSAADGPERPQRVRLTKEKATGLITLKARALESRRGGVLHDPWAERALELIDYDFAALKVHALRARLLSARARQLDLWTAEFLARHPNATVLHLGCGLDSRAFRVDPPAGARWFDVDYPDVLEVRRHIFPERPGYTAIGASLVETGWLAELPRDRPAFVVGEGVLLYLKEDVVRRLLTAVTDHFPEGELAFDAHGRGLVQYATRKGWTVGTTGAVFAWGIDHPQEVTRLVPRLQPLERLSLPQLARRFRMPWAFRASVAITSLVPALRAFSLYRFRF